MSDESINSKSAYAKAGVDLQASTETLNRVKQAVKSTYNSHVLAGLGAFGGLFDVSFLHTYKEPVLVASTDGVGTKTMVASATGYYQDIGKDIVHHCINDILVQGAKPLFFLDYVAASSLNPDIIAAIISGIADACKASNTVLLGGETAEMPGVYQKGEFDLVGTILGVVDKANIVSGDGIKAGDKILALMSGGLQTNGYSLARKAIKDFDEVFSNHTLGQELLQAHRSYLEPVKSVQAALTIKGMAHITGGGIPGNLPRILPEGLGATIDPRSWPIPEIFSIIQRRASVSNEEMFEVFNMGAGFLLIVKEEDVDKAQEACPETLYPIGQISEGPGISFV